MHFDVLVIGWGKAGKALAGKFNAAGKSVALVEKSSAMYGGTCINVACVPTKDLVVAADERRADDDPQSYFAAAVAAKNNLTAKLNAANYAMLDEAGVTLIDGFARFTGPKEIAVATAAGDEQVITADTIIVGTGAKPRTLHIPGASLPGVYDSTAIQQLTELPESLIVIGAGFIGLEFASMFAGFGSRVTVLDSGVDFAPHPDSDVSEAVAKTLADRGVEIISGARATAIASAELGGLTVATAAGEYTAAAVLVAAGRVPETADLGLATAGIATDERGYIVVNEQLETSVPGVYAVGDINGGPQFTYISFDDHRIVWDAVMGEGKRTKADRVAVPTATFITPPLATIGLSEFEAREAGYSVGIAAKPVAAIAAMPRPKILGETHGLIKFVLDKETEQILGATLFCTDAQELINLVALAMRNKLPYTLLRDGIWTHPASTEGFNEVLAQVRW